MKFVRTTAINKILALTKRKKIIQGGTSAGKTFGIIPILIDIAIKVPDKEISIVSESFPHLRRGAIKDFKKIMRVTGRWSDKCWHSSNFTYTFPNGSFIEFFSADNESKLRGARRNILYINEANNILFSSYYQMAIRTNEDIYIDFNPSMEFWAHTEVEVGKDAELIILTYKVNEALDATVVEDIESAREKGKTSEYWKNWWNVYGLGKIGSLTGAIFTNWKPIDSIPEEARLLGYGLDFGSIAEIFSYGLDIYPAKKGSDSVLFSIKLLQQQELLITKSSLFLIKELRGYLWATDKSGNQTGKPLAHVPDHLLDSLRYIAMEKLGRKEDSYSIH